MPYDPIAPDPFQTPAAQSWAAGLGDYMPATPGNTVASPGGTT